MGSVFEAHHATLRTRAAVKVLSPGLESEELFRQRFHREADLQAQLRHPNVLRVLDYLEDNGQWFLVVEYLDRGSLADLLARGVKVTRAQALTWVRQALAGLGHAHQKGIVHRDIKPANLLLGENGEIVVADFGIARADGTPALTTTGAVIGTPQYMSPEQIQTPDRIDGRSDIYSMGIVLYELLTGRKPFDSGSQFAVLQAQISQPPPPMRAIDPGIPPELEAAVMRALSKKPEDRPADCQSMIRDLDRAELSPAISQTMPVQPVPIPGGTVLSSDLFERASVDNSAGRSAGDLRNQRRRAFQQRLAAGVVAILIVAALLAFYLSKKGSTSARIADPIGPAPPTTNTTESVSLHEPIKEITKPPPFKQARTVTPPVFVDRPVTKTEGQAPPPPQTRPVPHLPERPRIAVIGTGDDPLLAGALEQEMEHRLDRFDVADEQGEPEVGELLKSKGSNVGFKELGAALLKNGFQILVLMRVEKAESRTITLQHVSGTIKAARIRLNAYLLPANRSIGSGWTELVEYTELSAQAKAHQAFIGPTADLGAAIDDDWSRLRAGGTP
jgi:serine/threonine-protein kinase